MMANTFRTQPSTVTGYPLKGFSIVIPDEGWNFVDNPSFEENLDGYTFSNSVGTRVTGGQCRGAYFLEINPTNPALVSYAECTILANKLTAGQLLFFSLDIRGKTGEEYLFSVVDDATSSVIFNSDVRKLTEKMTRQMFRYSIPATPITIRLRVTKQTASNNNWYMDGWKLSPLNCIYFDGDTPECYWIGAPHNSSSYRTIDSSGGEVFTDDELGYETLAFSGHGLPPIENRVTQYASIGGANYENTVILPRTITFNSVVNGANLFKVMAKRQRLISAVSPDGIRQQGQPIMIRFQAPNQHGELVGKELEAEYYYSGGLEGATDNYFQSNAALQFTQYRPIVREIYDYGQELVTGNLVENISFIHRRNANGEWDNFYGGVTCTTNGRINAIAQTRNAIVWIGGELDEVVSGGFTAGNFYLYNPKTRTVTVVGIGCNAEVHAILPNPDGSAIFAGAFTSAGGTAVNRVAQIDSAGTGTSIGGTLNGIIYTIARDRLGNVWFGGSTTSPSTAVAYRQPDGTWVAVSGLTGTCYSLGLGKDGYIYAGGTFGIKKRKAGDSAWTDVASITGEIYSLAFTKNGDLLAGGSITVIGGVTVKFIARSNGSIWEQMGSGVQRLGASDGYVRTIYVDRDGVIRIGGRFNADGNAKSFIGRQAYYSNTGGDGGDWLPIETESPQGTSTYNAETRCFFETFEGELLIGHERTGSADTAYVNNVAYTGTAPTSPILNFIGAGQPSYFANLTTATALYFKDPNLMLDDMRWRINFEPELFEMMSTEYGEDIFDTIREGSDTGSIALTFGSRVPQINKFAVLVPNTDSNSKCVMSFRPSHYSKDASAFNG